jgi:EF-hand domain pair
LWDRVRMIQRRYQLSDEKINEILELFEYVDDDKETESTGTLTFNELHPIMNAVTMEETNKFEFFMKVDVDNSGQIDFAEFIEMIVLIGLQYAVEDHLSKRFLMLKNEQRRQNNASDAHILIRQTSQGVKFMDKKTAERINNEVDYFNVKLKRETAEEFNAIEELRVEDISGDEDSTDEYDDKEVVLVESIHSRSTMLF